MEKIKIHRAPLIVPITMLILLLVSPAYAEMNIEAPDDIEVKRAPLEILCLGGLESPEAAHVLYNCNVEEFFYGDKPNPEVCQPVMPNLPPFRIGERAICPHDGSSSVHSDLPEARFGVLGEQMDIFTNKGWMPRKTRKRISD